MTQSELENQIKETYYWWRGFNRVNNALINAMTERDNQKKEIERLNDELKKIKKG